MLVTPNGSNDMMVHDHKSAPGHTTKHEYQHDFGIGTCSQSMSMLAESSFPVSSGTLVFGSTNSDDEPEARSSSARQATDND